MPPGWSCLRGFFLLKTSLSSFCNILWLGYVSFAEKSWKSVLLVRSFWRHALSVALLLVGLCSLGRGKFRLFSSSWSYIRVFPFARRYFWDYMSVCSSSTFLVLTFPCWFLSKAVITEWLPSGDFLIPSLLVHLLHFTVRKSFPSSPFTYFFSFTPVCSMDSGKLSLFPWL